LPEEHSRVRAARRPVERGLEGINLGSIEAIGDLSKRGILVSENARRWLEAEATGKRMMELGGLQLMQRAAALKPVVPPR
jgi:hypothetical protein